MIPTFDDGVMEIFSCPYPVTLLSILAPIEGKSSKLLAILMWGLKLGDSKSSRNGDGGSRTGGSLTRPLWQQRLNCLLSWFVWTRGASAFQNNALQDGHETNSHLSYVLRSFSRGLFELPEVDADADEDPAIWALFFSLHKSPFVAVWHFEQNL